MLLLLGAIYVLTMSIKLTLCSTNFPVEGRFTLGRITQSQWHTSITENDEKKERHNIQRVVHDKGVGHLLLINYVGNSFVSSNVTREETTKNGNLMVLVNVMPGHPHTGINLPSVRDELTGRSCTYTRNMSLYNKSDVVIVPGRSMKHTLPAYRPEGQRWIFYSAESFHYVRPRWEYQHVFNHTMTYHSHADIYSAQFAFIPRKDVEKEYKIPSKKSRKMVAWMASHCNTQSRRENFVMELSKYIHVDTFGGCGKKSCPQSRWCHKVLSKYKFYVAIENSLCNGYITEKPWIGFMVNTVPIVGGAGSETYKRVLPPHSYIDLDDFTSAKDVAEYLQLVALNDTLYREYFAWRADFYFGEITAGDIAGVTCEYLHRTKNNGPHLVDLMEFAQDSRSVCHKNKSWAS